MTGGFDTELRRLKAAGYPGLPQSPVQARITAKQVEGMVNTPGALSENARTVRAQMRRSRLANAARTGGLRRTGSDLTMALPKIRTPGMSLQDKGIPLDIADPKQLSEARAWSRLFYCIHDLVPLLIDIYARFPLTGLEFVSKDPQIENFYSDMFLNQLNYEEWLPECLGREYYISGEVTSLAHFNEELGIWSSEEILNPDMVRVSKSLFVTEERVQLLVKDMVESLRAGPQGMALGEESHSERQERTWEYCLITSMKVLTGDLNWVPVRSLRVGDKIVGFDEFGPGGKGSRRAWRDTEVTATKIISAPTFEIKTSGPRVTCTGEHMWLAYPREPKTGKGNNRNNRRGGPRSLQWIKTKDLLPGDKIQYMGSWEQEDSRDVGYVSGILDGEGWLTVGPSGYWLGFDQKPGSVLDKAVAILESHKFKLSKTPHPCGTVAVRVLGGVTEIMRCLGIFRPVRLLPKFYNTLDGRKLPGTQNVEVVSVEDRGVQDVVALATSTKTLMAEGMFSHNTQLVKHYPEVISAATQDDGLDISEALWSRIVNKTSPWDLRGTPFLMRSFGTLLMEESLNAAQDSVADRLYSPLILATLGIQDMGDGEPWIPDQSELDDLRDDFQSALAADFKLMCHHFGLQIQPVFGREAVPRFDQDYERIDMKLMQAWGIGSALVMGGTAAAGTYASSALNREVCELLMKGFQRKVVQHIRKRMEVIAEAQEHFDYELKGGVRRPLYREVIEEDPETGEKRVVRAPKLLIPEIRFSSLNLRDEQTERAFITQLKQMGIPISDKTMAVNLPVQFDQELVRQGNEKVDKLVAEAEAMSKAQKIIDQKELPYPAELAQWLTQTLVLRQQLAQTDLMETQQKQMEQQAAQMSPAGQLGLLPGTVPMPPPPPPGMEDDQAGGPPPGGPGMPPLGAAPPPVEVARNRARPEESDDLRAGAPRAAATNGHTRKLSQFERGPSSYGSARRASEQRVTDAVRRREVIARHPVPRMEDLVHDPGFYALLNSPHESQLQADWPAIMAGQARESADIARELAEQYEYVTGVTPEWD